MLKPGWKSSEFWVTVVSFLFSGLYLVGLLDDHQQKDDLIMEGSRGVEAVILIIGQLTVLYRYVKGRSEIKKIWGEKKDDKPKRSVKSRTTKTNRSSKKSTK